MAEAFANLGWDGREHTAMDASLDRPTEIALSRGNLGKANEK
ncbi:MAG TPA: hypothetical protein VK211_26585 [Kamptonema sp.]|nr:hypothetical protein [Kamptonema sp.]